jgi:hypothetical protein
MTGYVLAWGPCLCCRAVFAFNPHRVPSSSAVTGEREPVCRPCMEMGNRMRVERGMAPHPIHPEAYEALPEEEL